MASAPTTRKRLRPETTEFIPESTALQFVMREIRLREEQARREAEMAARERQRDEELQLRIQLSHSYNISNDAV